MADPVVWESVSRTLSQQYRLSNLVSPDRSPEVGGSHDQSDVASRSPSQRLALKRFERDLEKYAKATGARGKVVVDPSTATQSEATLHTLDELLPFHRQFAAAGLAVTSAEQKGKCKDKGKGKAPRKHKYVTPQDQVDLFQLDGGPSRKSPEMSESSDSTMLHFTTANPDDLSHLLVDELPPPKQKRRIQRKLFQPSEKDGREKHRKGRRLLHKKEAPYPRQSQLERVVEDDVYPGTEDKLAAPTKAIQNRGQEKRAESISKPLPKLRRDVDFATIHYQAPCPKGTDTAMIKEKISKKSGGDPRSQIRDGVKDQLREQPDADRPQTKPSKSRVRYPDQNQQGRASGKRKANQVVQDSRAKEIPDPEKPSESRAEPVKVTTRASTRAGRTDKERQKRRPVVQASEEYVARTTPSPVQRLPPSSTKPTVPQKSKRRPKPVDLASASGEEMEEIPARHPKEAVTQTSPPPDLPFTWKYAVAGSSSLERALDAAREKVDTEDRLPACVQDSAPAQRKPSTTAGWSRTKSKLRSPPSLKGENPKASSLYLNSVDQTVDYRDQDIDDRAVLKGMKMAIAAACDERLDAFVRDRTGMRLRRFFADLTVFEDLEREWTQTQGEAASLSTVEQVTIAGKAAAGQIGAARNEKARLSLRKENDKA